MRADEKIFSLDNPCLTPGERSLLEAFSKNKGVFAWQAKVEKEEGDGVLLVAYGGADPKTGPMVKVRPHTNNEGNRVIGVDICFVDRSNHDKDFNVFVGAEEFWPLCNDIITGAFFKTLEREALEAQKAGKMASPQRYSYKAGKRDDNGKGGGALQAGFCLSKFPGKICLHGYNGKTSDNYNVPATYGSMQMMAYMFNTLFDIGESAKLRFEAAKRNRLEHSSKNDSPEPDIDETAYATPEEPVETQPESIELKGTVKAGNPKAVDGNGNHYFLALLGDGTQAVVKLPKMLNFTVGNTFTIKGHWTSDRCNVGGNLIPSFMAD